MIRYMLCVDVDSDGFTTKGFLTLNKIYKVYNDSNLIVEIINDQGYRDSFGYFRFRPLTVKELRNLKLNEICGHKS